MLNLHSNLDVDRLAALFRAHYGRWPVYVAEL